jgi:mitochondrial fission protein ELM1
MTVNSSFREGPTLIVACGWDTISYSSSIRHLASGNVFVIQIQHPRSRLDRFDLVVTPRHDYYALIAGGQEEIPRLFRRWITPQEPPGRNVVLTVGALHQADSAALRLAAIAWHDELAPLPKPLLIVNIGGPTSRSPYLSHVAHSIVSVFGYVVLL